jgi:hypothetical protein
MGRFHRKGHYNRWLWYLSALAPVCYDGLTLLRHDYETKNTTKTISKTVSKEKEKEKQSAGK